MAGVVHVDGFAVEATTGQMLVTFSSGGDPFRFHLPANVALSFRQKVMNDAWQVCCAPDAELVDFAKAKRKRRKG